MVVLRKYQAEAVDAIESEWASGNLHTLLTMATGTGKTTVFGEIARRKLDLGVLVLAHRDELIRQAAARLSDMCGCAAEIEKADERYKGISQLCIGSVQTLCNENRLAEFPAHAFGTVIVDEAHHSVSESYKRVLSAFPYARVLGVTATPDRSDKRGLAEIYDSIAYEYGIERAVHDGYLSPIKAKLVPLSMDISKVKVSHGDYQVGELGDALEPYLAQIAQVMVSECANRKTVVFLPLVSTAEKMTDALNAIGMRAVVASGYDDSKTRKDKLAAFERGEYDVICNSMLLTEGWDCPEVDCVVILRPTKSRSLYAQMVGRGTRIAEGKKDLLLLDFLWQTEKHDLCRPATLLGAEPAIVAKMTEGIEKRGYAGEEVDLIDAEDEAKAEVQAEREASLAKKLEEQRHRKKKLVDPLQYAMSIMSFDLTDYEPMFAWEKAEPTAKQKETLEKFQIDPTEIETKGQASALLDALMTRIDQGLSTPKQIRFLEGKGYQHVGTWTKEQASVAIGRISANKWRVPWDIRPGVYETTAAFANAGKRKVA